MIEFSWFAWLNGYIPTMYRRVVIDENIDTVIKETCKGIEERFEIKFIEIGNDRDHVHFLIQPIPTMSPSEIIRITKSITAKRVFKECHKVKKTMGRRNLVGWVLCSYSK